MRVGGGGVYVCQCVYLLVLFLMVLVASVVCLVSTGPRCCSFHVQNGTLTEHFTGIMDSAVTLHLETAWP